MVIDVIIPMVIPTAIIHNYILGMVCHMCWIDSGYFGSNIFPGELSGFTNLGGFR